MPVGESSGVEGWRSCCDSGIGVGVDWRVVDGSGSGIEIIDFQADVCDKANVLKN